MTCHSLATSFRDTNSKTMTSATHIDSSHSSSSLTTSFPNAVKEMLITEELKLKNDYISLSKSPLNTSQIRVDLFFCKPFSIKKRNPHFIFFFSPFSSVIHQKPDSR